MPKTVPSTNPSLDCSVFRPRWRIETTTAVHDGFPLAVGGMRAHEVPPIWRHIITMEKFEMLFLYYTNYTVRRPPISILFFFFFFFLPLL